MYFLTIGRLTGKGKRQALSLWILWPKRNQMRTTFPVVWETFICLPTSENVSIFSFQYISSSGAINGDGDRKRAPGLVLEMWYRI